ncbi:MAG: Imm32 family immunity protein [Planctomycetota bacterium]|jgi:hypothetical protein
MSKIYGYPDKSGNIDIYPKIEEGHFVSVTIIGDPKGLKYLAEFLNWLADRDQEENETPAGSREHIHLHANKQLGAHSCEVEICRADAKGTGRLPEFMRPN